MKGKIKYLIGALVLICTIVIGIFIVGNYSFKKNLEEATRYINNGDYNLAIEAFSKLENSKFNKEGEFSEIEIAGVFMESEKLFKEGNLEEAKKSIEKIHKGYADYGKVKKDVEALEQNINTEIKNRKIILQDIEKLKKLVKEKKLEDGKKIANSLKGKNISGNQKEEVRVLEDILIKLEKDKIEAKKKAKEEAEKAREAAKNRILTVAEARARIYNEDSINLNQWLKEGNGILEYIADYPQETILNSVAIPVKNGFYTFYINGEHHHIGTYLVDKKTGNVYRAGNQGGMPIHLVRNNQIIKTYPWNQNNQ